MPLTSSVVNQLITNFKLYCCSKKFQMLQKNVKSLLEQLKVCIFAKIVFGVRCTLRFQFDLSMTLNKSVSFFVRLSHIFLRLQYVCSFTFMAQLCRLEQKILLKENLHFLSRNSPTKTPALIG